MKLSFISVSFSLIGVEGKLIAFEVLRFVGPQYSCIISTYIKCEEQNSVKTHFNACRVEVG
jgi:hypothetical protein